MQRFGRERRECYVWWGGYFMDEGAQICTALVPDVPTEFGCVHLDNATLATLHTRLRGLDQVLIAELHTHPPGAGGQNEVDAAHPAATYNGFTSIVVPDFAFPLFHDLRDAFVYEYAHGGGWTELSRDEVQARFVVEETCLCVAT
jgi:hypothetical protein